MSGQNVAFVLALLGPFPARMRLGGRLAGGLAVLVLFEILTRREPSALRVVAMAALALRSAAGEGGRGAAGGLAIRLDADDRRLAVSVSRAPPT